MKKIERIIITVILIAMASIIIVTFVKTQKINDILEEITEVNTQLIEDINEEIEEMKNEMPEMAGVFTVTAYCKCEKCCGVWTDSPTKSGTQPVEGRTVAVDPDVIPLGTEIIIDGNIYTAEDTGSAIKGNRIDIYFTDHQKAVEFGVKEKEVWT